MVHLKTRKQQIEANKKAKEVLRVRVWAGAVPYLQIEDATRMHGESHAFT